MVAPDESDAYFAGRPLNSRLGAWASTQSGPLESSQALAQRVEEFRQRFADQEVPRPPHWGGFRLVADRIEFWQGRPSRLHDRFSYVLDAAGSWHVGRLNP
jgi:pyridoxamine 5'-phosphate oxidase